jgi:hypothetical protein
MEHAAKYSAGLKLAVEGARAAQAALLEMARMANPDENENLQRLLHRGGLYERAAQHFGLNDFVKFEHFAGGPQDLIPLEAAFAQVLGGWLEVEATQAK